MTHRARWIEETVLTLVGEDTEISHNTLDEDNKSRRRMTFDHTITHSFGLVRIL